MNFLKIMIIFSVIGGLIHFRDQYQAKTALETANVSPNGFIELPVTGVSSDIGNILVIAAQNCPKEDAQRADELAAELSRLGIPNTRAQNIHFTLTEPDPAILSRVNSVMSGPLPIVFVNGKAKANPTLDDVIAEYNLVTERSFE